MKRSEQEAKLEELYRQIEELQKVEIEEDELWKPDYNEQYWYIGSDSCTNDCNWYNDRYDYERLLFGNVFKTEEEAKFNVERIKVISELKRFSRNFEIYKNNYCIKYDMISKNIEIYNNYVYATGEICFASEKDAKDAIEFVGEDRVLKYYLGVEE